MPEPSPHVRVLVEEITALDRRIAELWGAAEPEDHAPLIEAENRRETLTTALAREPALTPADLSAKLTVLCCRLRTELAVTDVVQVTTYMLAESARDGML